jgi:hypothetical protein
MYRNDWDAAIARAEALDQSLRAAQAKGAVDDARVQALTAELNHARMEIARLRGMATAGAPYMQGYLPGRGAMVLTLGILSLVLCSVLGPVAWAMGAEDLRRIDEGHMDPNARSMVQAGRICGICGTAVLAFGLLAIVWFSMCIP